MLVIAGRDFGIASLDTIIRPYAEGAFLARATASADSMSVTVEDMWGPVALNSPITQGELEVREGGEDLALDDWRHFGGGGKRGVG